MRYLRILMMAALVLALSLAAGCGEKIYLFDFTTETDLSREDGTWTAGGMDYVLSPDGIALQNAWVAAPHLYNGDFTVSFKFQLLEDISYNRTAAFILASGTNFLLAEWSGMIVISDDQHDPGDFQLSQIKDGYTTVITPSRPVDDILEYPGLNTMEIKKRGDLLTFKLNGIALGDGILIEGYYLDWLCPQMTTFYEIGSDMDNVVFKSVEVRYKGDAVPST